MSSQKTAGSHAPADELVAEVYSELRRLAGRYVRREQARSVQATDLVHEAYLRLKKEGRPAWTNRTHFLAIAAISMRRLLVERARARNAAKRGGHQVQVTLDDGLIAGGSPDEAIDLVALDRAIETLAAFDPQQARIVELRFFGGCRSRKPPTPCRSRPPPSNGTGSWPRRGSFAPCKALERSDRRLPIRPGELEDRQRSLPRCARPAGDRAFALARCRMRRRHRAS
jgi:RNA polymerase sigma factor (TIGR02999 family)